MDDVFEASVLLPGDPTPRAFPLRTKWRDVARAGSANIFAAAASLLILVMTSRALGPAGRGVYAAATAWVGFFASLGSLSLGQVVLHHATRARGDMSNADTVGTLRALIAGITIIAWVVAAAAYVSSAGRFFQHVPVAVLAIAFASLPFSLWFDNGRYLLFAQDRVREFNYSQFIGYSTSVVFLGLVLFVLRLGMTGAIAAWVLLYAILAMITYRAATLDQERPRFNAALAGLLLRSGAKLHLNTISTFVHLQSSVLILNHFRPAADVGYYQLATQVVSLGTLVPMGISAVTYTQVATSSPDIAWARQRQLVLLGLAAAAVSIVVGYVASPLAVRLLAGDAFAPAIPLIRALLLSLFGMSLSITMASQWIGRGLFWQTAALSGSVAAISLALDVILIPRYGMYGALWSTLAIYTISLVVNGVFVMKLERQYRLGMIR